MKAPDVGPSLPTLNLTGEGPKVDAEAAVEQNKTSPSKLVPNAQAWKLHMPFNNIDPKLLDTSISNDSLKKHDEMLEKTKNPEKKTPELNSKKVEGSVPQLKTIMFLFLAQRLALLNPSPFNFMAVGNALIPIQITELNQLKHAHRISQAFQMK